ncbi:SRPBCC domain-containing protein [Sphingobium chungangianum]
MLDTAFDQKTGFDPANVVSSDKVTIEAPAGIVWEILVDLDRYGEWNPFCVKAASTLEIGAPVHMSLVNYPNPGALLVNCEYVCAFEPERRLAWEAPWHEAWPYAARRDQMIEPVEGGNCRYWSTDAFLGENGVHVMRFCGPWVKRAFDDTARALKARAEAFHAERQAGSQ